MKKIEDKAFTEFCKQFKIKNVSEFEVSQGGHEFFDKKCELEQLISKLETEMHVLESNLNLNQISILKSSLEQEESQLKSLLSVDQSVSAPTGLDQLISQANKAQKF